MIAIDTLNIVIAQKHVATERILQQQQQIHRNRTTAPHIMVTREHPGTLRHLTKSTELFIMTVLIMINKSSPQCLCTPTDKKLTTSKHLLLYDPPLESILHLQLC